MPVGPGVLPSEVFEGKEADIISFMFMLYLRSCVVPRASALATFGVLLNSLAKSSRKAYLSKLSGYLEFACSQGGQFCKLHRIMSFCQGEAAKNSFISIRIFVSAWRWFTALTSLKDYTRSQLFSKFLVGLQRQFGGPQSPKLPITKEILIKLVDHLKRSETKASYRDRALCLTAYGGFFRADEVLHLRWNDLNFSSPGTLTISLRQSKTDRFRAGSEVRLPSTGTSLCPISAIVAYRQKVFPNGVSGDDFVF